MATDQRDFISEKIWVEIDKIKTLLEQLPGVVVINDIRDGSVVYMTKRGLELLGVSLEELQQLGPAYHSLFFNQEFSKEYVPGILEMVNRNDPSETITLFQQVKFKGKNEWQWHLTSLRLFGQNNDGKPLALIAISQHLNENLYTNKIERLTNELTFLKDNIKTYNSLGKREKEILRLTADGKSTSQIAKALFISSHTAETHRKNIRRKLQIENTSQLVKFAQAFDLI